MQVMEEALQKGPSALVPLLEVYEFNKQLVSRAVKAILDILQSLPGKRDNRANPSSQSFQAILLE
jgi:hypothetical protein